MLRINGCQSMISTVNGIAVLAKKIDPCFLTLVKQGFVKVFAWLMHYFTKFQNPLYLIYEHHYFAYFCRKCGVL